MKLISTLLFLSSLPAFADGSFNYAQADAAFKAAQLPVIASVTGTWKMVASVDSNDNPTYELNGITNSDGSLYDELAFKTEKNLLNGADQLIVQVNNLGDSGANQGPYVASVVTKNPNGAPYEVNELTFQTLGYLRSDVLDSNTTYVRHCRIVKASGAMLCYIDNGDEYDMYVKE